MSFKIIDDISTDFILVKSSLRQNIAMPLILFHIVIEL